jgi:DNA-binding response OmpR family regulator
MILFIDDERREMDSYYLELELSGYQVRFKTDVDAALIFFDDHLDSINMVILDIMMPPGKIFANSDTKLGLRTGLPVFERLREKSPHLPILILTNVSDTEVRNRFRQEDRCWFYRKEDVLPFELIQYIEEILENPQ